VSLQVLAGLDSSDTRLVKALMHGSANPAEDYPSAPWLFDIVSDVAPAAARLSLLLWQPLCNGSALQALHACGLCPAAALLVAAFAVVSGTQAAGWGCSRVVRVANTRQRRRQVQLPASSG
jgi:hypothetical protein